jgi:pantoate--beta-alanine ligase
MMAPVLSGVAALRAHLDMLRGRGARIAVVPTMGALHSGHQALIRRARQLADEVAVTIFVNPTQFGPGEDFEKYPRQLEADRLRAEEAGATFLFTPEAPEMYPPGDQTRVSVGALAEGLCGASRPGHFTGVATVVTKFFALLAPAAFVFGQKDYQQLKVLERVARDLLLPVEIVPHATVREADGLALSSRNVYLSPAERQAALGIPAALAAAQRAYAAGERDPERLTQAASVALRAQNLAIEYVELRSAESLQPIDVAPESALALQATSERWVLLIAARSGATRLIDNSILGHDPELGGR